ncbi:MAG: type II secretion system secretin GspD, partial [Candidatus Omnitrophica bacterium]|nr:type II secretion system secretin GspD [Candidatus Omnitrophota bacterium]
IPEGRVIDVFMSILDVKGFSTVPAGDFIKIMPAMKARTKSTETIFGRQVPAGVREGMITQVISLEYSDANEIRGLVTTLAGKEVTVVAYPAANMMIMTGNMSNVQRLVRIINELDTDLEGEKKELAVIDLEYAVAQDIAAKITSFAGKAGAKGRAVNKQNLLGAVKVIPDTRTNALVIMASAKDIIQIKELVSYLDKEVSFEAADIRVYYLEHADAETLATTLSTMMASRARNRAAGKAGQPGQPVEMRIVADKTTNALLVNADREDFAVLENIIEKLDIMMDQVLVEALIVEASMSSITQLGIEWASLDEPSGKDVTGFGGTNFDGNISTVRSGTSLSGFNLGLVKGFASDGLPAVGAILQALGTDTDINILATPSILTSDNQEAKIIIGDNIPYVTDSRVTELDTVVQTYGYKDVGINLRITPHISRNGYVKLEVYQEITSVLTSSTTPTTSKRQAETTVTIKDGSTLVIAGLIRNDETKTVNKVPFLGDIPLLGLLFRKTSDTIEKKNMLIFITPHIMTDFAAAEALSDEKKRKMLEVSGRESLRTQRFLEESLFKSGAAVKP